MKTHTTPQPAAPLASTSLNSKERKAQRLLVHYVTCERLARYLAGLYPAMPDRQIDGKKVSVWLYKAEQVGTRRAEGLCSDSLYTCSRRPDVDLLIIQRYVINALGTLPPGFFVNSDPRGYALNIDNETPEGKALIEAVGLRKDMGGYGILSPEINGDR